MNGNYFDSVKNEPSQERLFYEGLCGFRVLDTHWAEIEIFFSRKDIALSFENLRIYYTTKKTRRSGVFVPEMIKQLADFQKELEKIKKPFTGREIVLMLDDIGVRPNQATISRWFKEFGGFKQTKIYCHDWTMKIMLKAYQYRQYSPKFICDTDFSA